MKQANTYNLQTLKKYLGRGGVAVIPIEQYEQMQEDLEMYQSRKLASEIEKARQEIKEGKIYSLEQVKNLIK